jgi:hypothetical protein
MPDTFMAQTITQSEVQADGTLLLTFADANGITQPVSLPLRVAADMTTVLERVKSQLPHVQGAPQFIKNVNEWQVGRSNEAPMVLLRVDHDAPLGFSVESAKLLGQSLQAEAAAVGQRPPHTTQ